MEIHQFSELYVYSVQLSTQDHSIIRSASEIISMNAFSNAEMLQTFIF